MTKQSDIEAPKITRAYKAVLWPSRAGAYSVLGSIRWHGVLRYNDGETVISDRRRRELTGHELLTGKVGQGIHVMLRGERGYAINFPQDGVLDVEVDPGDHVATSEDGNDAVYMKVKVIGHVGWHTPKMEDEEE